MQGRMRQSGPFLRMITLLLAATVRVGADPTRKPTAEPTPTPTRNPTAFPTPVSTAIAMSPHKLIYIGFEQNFTVPSNVTSITVTLYGGSGARATDTHGRGAMISSVVPVTTGEVLMVMVGSAGQIGIGSGGYNGGGGGQFSGVGRGGGATDIRRYPYSLEDRFLIAGGGGGGGYDTSFGGDGGVDTTRYLT